MTNPTGPDDPDAQDECATCGHARWRHRPVDGSRVCTEYVDCACEGNFVELSHATRMARVIEAAGTLAEHFATFRASLQGTMQSLHVLHHAMKVAGLLPEDDQPEQATAGKHSARIAGPGPNQPLMDEIHATMARALDIPQALITGPSPDGMPDHWTGAAPLAMAGVGARMSESCPTCWPRPCDPTRPMCRRNSDVTQTMPAVQDDDPNEPHLCDGCGRTDQPVTATDDGRALACPDCLPAANANIAADYCPDCGHPWAYSATGDCCMPVKPGTNTPATTPNDPTTRCGCTTTPPATRTQTGLQSHPEQAAPPA